MNVQALLLRAQVMCDGEENITAAHVYSASGSMKTQIAFTISLRDELPHFVPDYAEYDDTSDLFEQWYWEEEVEGETVEIVATHHYGADL